MLVGCQSGSGTPVPAATTDASASTSPVSDSASPQPSVLTSSLGTATGQVLGPEGTPTVGCALEKGGGTEEAISTDALGGITFQQDPGEGTVRFRCSGASENDATTVIVKAGETSTLTVWLTQVP